MLPRSSIANNETVLPLSSTPNKEAIRRLWDKPIIADFAKRIKKPLSYFGLPGPDIRDFHDWGSYLGWKTCVENLSKSGHERLEQLRKINQLQTNIMLSDFNDQWELRRGQIEDIILDGTDIDGKKPALLSIDTKPPTMKYDLHNWDFQGGLYTASKKKGSKRIQAIEHCIRLQRGYHFLFLLTLNVRHTLGEELAIYLNGAAKDITSTKHKEILHWYAGRGAFDKTEHCRIKAVVPLFIRQIAHVNSFDCFCYPPLYYEGWKEHLLHFVFELFPKGTILPAFSKQDTSVVIELPLIKIQDGNFVLVLQQQHPHFDEGILGSISQSGLPLLELVHKT